MAGVTPQVLRAAARKTSPGRKMARAEALMKQVRLRAFADSRGSEENQPPRPGNFGLTQAGCGRSFEPGSAGIVVGGAHEITFARESSGLRGVWLPLGIQPREFRRA